MGEVFTLQFCVYKPYSSFFLWGNPTSNIDHAMLGFSLCSVKSREGGDGDGDGVV